MPSRIWLLVLVLLAVGLPAAPALAQGGGGTLTYIDGQGQVAVADLATGEGIQVTTSGEWQYPSMADDGTIVAVQGRPSLTMVRMTQAGEVLSTVTPSVNATAGVVNAEVSPDGSLIAFETFRGSTDGASSFSHEVWIIPSDGSTSTPIAVVGGPGNPRWYPGQNTTVAVSGISTFDVGTMDGTGTPWFSTEANDERAMDLSDDASLLAVAGTFPSDEEFDPNDPLGTVVSGVKFYILNGAPPTAPSELTCFFPDDDESISGLALSPDGTDLVIEQGSSLTILIDLDLQECSNAGSTTIDGGTDPHISTAPIGGGTPGPGPGPGVPPGPGGPLPDGVVRLDGGGQADPVAQAVFLSQQLFEDGEASRVVLATADNFPDALAGTALAGPSGPILFTSGTGDLDPRVATEISRVTGGSAPVLTLGGVNAVPEVAAATARAAGGDTTCAAPLPASCRFAGSGREETATLIADTVAAENPDNAGIAMIAKGNDFADAITGGAFAAAVGIPILLTPTDQANQFTTDWLQAHTTDLLIALGGTAALTDATLQAMPATDIARIAGADRTATSAAIAADLWQANGLGTGGVAIVNVRAADGWQTALSAAVASARLDIPQLGVEGPPAELTQPVLDYLANIPSSTGVFGFGDTGLVSDAQLQQAAGARN